ncbi:unnamed protein product [Mytilus edulis]|uniref:Uncharacterized protein n=1 Tax=Mytilus edulis TaxID=6550 RepID=A0A8S3TDP7_MYTED|nr:unnamed protein product [Mytilus edulis]
MSLEKPEQKESLIANFDYFINIMNKTGRNKLTLKKSRKMDSSHPPLNQEALAIAANEMNDSDFDDLDLTDLNDNTGPPPIDIAFEAVNRIEEVMGQRLGIAKAREGMVYGKTSNNMPPFCHLNMRCTPDLGNVEMNNLFRDQMKNITEETRNTFTDRIIRTLDGFLEEKKETITTIRREAKEKIGTTSKSAGTARSIMYKKIELNMLKDHNDRKLAEFKAAIRYKQPEKT